MISEQLTGSGVARTLLYYLKHDGERVEQRELDGEDRLAALVAQVKDGGEEQVAGQCDGEQHARRPRVQPYEKIAEQYNSVIDYSTCSIIPY